MKRLTQEEINKALENHKHWLAKDCDKWENMQADFSYCNLHNANLCNANLCKADLHNAILRNADLCNANLRNANLCKAILHNANLCKADLHNANLQNADLCNANLRHAYLYKANLRNADLRNADLQNVDLGNAKNVPYIPMVCPEEEKQLTKAKEIIKNLVDSLIAIDGEQIKELKTVKEAEQFLNSEVEE